MLTGYRLHYHRQQVVARIRVAVSQTGACEVLVLRAHRLDDIALEKVWAVDAEVADVGDAGGVRQQVAQRDRRSGLRERGQIVSDGIVVTQLALFGEHHHRHRGESFGDRGDVDRFVQERSRITSWRRDGIAIDRYAVPGDEDGAGELAALVQPDEHPPYRLRLAALRCRSVDRLCQGDAGRKHRARGADSPSRASSLVDEPRSGPEAPACPSWTKQQAKGSV